MQIKKYLAPLFIAAIIFTSCCKDPGDGGEAVLIIRLKHHVESIPSQPNYPDSVFIKYDAEELPGTAASSFDRIAIAKGTDDYVRVEGLKCGKYYLYGTGWHAADNARVTGGMAYKIKHSKRKKEIEVDLQVSD